VTTPAALITIERYKNENIQFTEVLPITASGLQISGLHERENHAS
jgi:hypothetical protein